MGSEMCIRDSPISIQINKLIILIRRAWRPMRRSPKILHQRLPPQLLIAGEIGPLIENRGRAATVLHVIDGRAAAPGAALVEHGRAAGQVGIRLRGEVPEELVRGRDRVERGQGGDVDGLGVGAIGSGFEEDYADAFVLGELLGEDEAGWATADDGVVYYVI